jgi:hypothetical protein
LTRSGTGGTIVDNSNNRFKEMKWNHNSVNTNVTLPDFFSNQNALSITNLTNNTNNEQDINVKIDVSGITTYDTDTTGTTLGSVKLPYKLTATPQSRTYKATPSSGQANNINVIKTSSGAPTQSDSTNLSVTIDTPTLLSESGKLTCQSSLTKINIPDSDLNNILYDLMRKHKSANPSQTTFTLQDTRNLIDNKMSGIVSEVDNVPLNFYVAVRLFNNDAGTNKIGGVGAATDVNTAITSVTQEAGRITPFKTDSNKGKNTTGTITTTVLGDTPPTPAQEIAGNTETPFPSFTSSQNFGVNQTKDTSISINQQPGVIASRKLFIWIVFKNKSEITNATLPVNTSSTIIPSGGVSGQ